MDGEQCVANASFDFIGSFFDLREGQVKSPGGLVNRHFALDDFLHQRSLVLLRPAFQDFVHYRADVIFLLKYGMNSNSVGHYMTRLDAKSG